MRLTLMDVCRTGNLPAARRCIRRGDDLAQTDDGRWTPLTYACNLDMSRLVKLLLKSGANAGQVSNDGVSFALYVACFCGNVEITQLLLDRGADVGQVAKDGQSAFYAACAAGNTDAVRLLLERGAVAHADNEGRTPIQRASKEGHDAIVDPLREHAATAVCEDEASSASREGYGFETAAALETRLSRRSLEKRVCANCGERAPLSSPKPQKCGGCWGPRYCEKSCQQAHWGSGHKGECGAPLPAEVPS